MEAAGAGTSVAFGLLRPPGRAVTEVEGSEHVSDLHLDQIVSGITSGREDRDELGNLLLLRSRDVQLIHHRHEVFRDLEDPAVWSALRQFSDSVREVLSHLAQAREMRVVEQRQGWSLDAVAIYCAAVRSLAASLRDARLGSAGMLGFREFLDTYAGSDEFGRLDAETGECKAVLAGVSYCAQIAGPRVTVTRYAGEPDYSEEIQSVFARFRQGSVRSYLVEYRLWPGMTRVGEEILALVVRLFPEEFALLRNFAERHRNFFDPDVLRFFRELQFFTAYRDYIDPLTAAGLAFCYPEVDAQSREELVEHTFDLALAKKLITEGGNVVPNDYRLAQGERIFVVSGPNQGGKTTFARTFGQLHHLAALGLPVPGQRARLFLCDRIFTHFQREEDSSLLAGKLESDLLDMQRTLALATTASIVIMNEVFSSTSLEDARFLGAEVMRKLIGKNCLGVFVSFIDELASLAPSVVSMISTIVPGDPSQRTFKVVRGPANGLAYALAIAEKYRLTYPQLLERIP